MLYMRSLFLHLHEIVQVHSKKDNSKYYEIKHFTVHISLAIIIVLLGLYILLNVCVKVMFDKPKML